MTTVRGLPARTAHPRLVAVLHAAYWTVYLLLLAVIFTILRLLAHREPAPVPALAASRIGAMLLFPNIAAFYVAYGPLFSRYLATRRLGALGLGLVIVSLGVALLAAGVAYQVGAVDPLVFADRVDLAGFVAWLTAVAAIHATLALVMRGFIGWYGDLAVKEALGRRTHEVELALIRSKLDPHFLFNTLNNIDVLIGKDPEIASAYLKKLSDIMRFVLYESRAEMVPLAAEVEYIEKYLALEAIRRSNPRFACLDVSGPITEVQVAPMLFIPFIENAFTHAAGQRGDGSVAITVAVDGARLAFRCANAHGPAGAQGAARGLGNPLMADRLALLYPGRHRLALADDGRTFTVDLTIDR